MFDKRLGPVTRYLSDRNTVEKLLLFIAISIGKQYTSKTEKYSEQKIGSLSATGGKVPQSETSEHHQ